MGQAIPSDNTNAKYLQSNLTEIIVEELQKEERRKVGAQHHLPAGNIGIERYIHVYV